MQRVDVYPGNQGDLFEIRLSCADTRVIGVSDTAVHDLQRLQPRVASAADDIPALYDLIPVAAGQGRATPGYSHTASGLQCRPRPRRVGGHSASPCNKSVSSSTSE